MEPDIRISIGMCVKDAEATIWHTVNSILDQDFSPHLMELIVVDGNSTDRTISVIQGCLMGSELKNCKILHENEGLGYARQLVVDHASGDYILWADDDLLIAQDYTRKLVDIMDKDKEIGIAKGKYKLDLGDPSINLPAKLENMGRRFKYLDSDYEGAAHATKSMATEGCMYRAKAIRQVGGFDKRFRKAYEDWDAEYRLKKAGWKLHIADTYFSYFPRRISWKSIWKRYFQFGYAAPYFAQKNRGAETLPTMLPPVAFLSGLLRALHVFRGERERAAFLFPLHSVVNMTAWWTGFIVSCLGRSYVS